MRGSKTPRARQVGGVGDHSRLPLDRIDDACGLAVEMDPQGLHLITLASEVFSITARSKAMDLTMPRCSVGRTVSAESSASRQRNSRNQPLPKAYGSWYAP